MKRIFLFFWILLLASVLSAQSSDSPQNLDANGKLPRATPESQGISSDVLTRLIERLRDEITAPNSLMVLRHGRVIAECWWNPHGPQTTHALYSLSKSFTSTAAGFAISEGKLNLDAKLTDLFANSLPADFTDPASASKYELLRKARLRDLLTMTCGHEREPQLQGLFPLDFSRPEGETWQQTFLKAPFKFEPGTHFVYSTAGTFMVSAAVQQATGQTVRDYLISRLFEPLRIETPYWESNSEGISKGGTGLFLHTEDLAKFGQFCLQRGKWNGQQLLPAEWVDQATSFQVPNGADPRGDWSQGYGFQFWRCRYGVFRGDGMFSQFMVVIPEKDVVVAITSDSNEYQKILDVLFDELLPEQRTAEGAPKPAPAFANAALPENPDARKRLEELAASLIVRDGASGSKVLEGLRLPSKILGRDTTFCVYLPNGYLTTGFEYPILYLLHGGGDVGDAWLKKGNLKEIADAYFKDRPQKAVIVMPYCEDGRWRNDFEGKNRYEDYFTQELIPYVESTFRIRKDRDSRAISGLSRGGYGSLFYSLRHPDLFGTCFAMSPTMRPHAEVESMPEEEFLKLYGSCVSSTHQAGDLRLTDFFLNHDVLTMVTKLPEEQKKSVQIFIDCGDDDHLVSGSCLLHLAMLQYGIPHELRIRDGAHNWDYWKVSLPMALDFFLK